MTANPVYDAIRTRRVTRAMTDEPVDPALVEQVLQAARWAPNAGTAASSRERLSPLLSWAISARSASKPGWPALASSSAVRLLASSLTARKNTGSQQRFWSALVPSATNGVARMNAPGR